MRPAGCGPRSAGLGQGRAEAVQAAALDQALASFAVRQQGAADRFALYIGRNPQVGSS
jgi:hypothetical protein